MRRSEKEITSQQEIEAIVQEAQVCRIGLMDQDFPYIVPLSFGYKSNCLYFHSATEGKKLDIIRRNSSVCFEIDLDQQVMAPAENSCKWSARYRSIIGFGKVHIIQELQEKLTALNIITQHYGGSWCEFPREELERVCVLKIEIQNMTGKQSGY